MIEINPRNCYAPTCISLAMPLYFFDIHNDDTTIDEEGMDLPDDATAIERAYAEARLLAAESIVRMGHLILSHRIALARADRSPLADVTFGQAVDVKD